MVDPDSTLTASRHAGSGVMLALFAIVAVDAIGAGVILPLLPFYALHFGASAMTLGMLVASFAMCQFLAAPWIGQLSDRHGRKSVLLASQLGTFVSLVVLACANSIGLLFVARMIDGISSGNISVAAALAIDRSTPTNRKQAIGIISAAIGVGMIIGPMLSSLLVRYAITAPIWAAAGFSAASVMATALLLESGAPVPTAGAPKTGQSSAFTLLNVARLPHILALLAVFYLIMGMYISQAALFFSARFAYGGKPLGPREIGFAFACFGVINIFVQLVAMKKIARWFSEGALGCCGLGLLSVGFIVLGNANGLGMLALALVCISLGSAISRPTLTAALTLLAPAHQQGAVMGLNTSVMALFNIAGPLLAGFAIGRGWYGLWAAALAMLAGGAALVVLGWMAKGTWPTPAR